jgi:hypothetical protein
MPTSRRRRFRARRRCARSEVVMLDLFPSRQRSIRRVAAANGSGCQMSAFGEQVTDVRRPERAEAEGATHGGEQMSKIMNRRIRRVGLRTIRRHPRAVLRASLFAGRHWRGVTGIAGAVLPVTRRAQGAAQAVTDPRVRSEARLAVTGLADAARRARRLGIAGALEDKRIAAQLRGASRHASNAVAAGRSPRRRPVARASVVSAGVGALAAAGYVGWRVCSPSARHGG